MATRALPNIRAAQRSDADEAEIHPLDALLGLLSVRVAIRALVRRVEALDGDVRGASVERSRRHLGPHLPRLAEVAQVGRSDQTYVGGRKALGLERLGSLLLEAGVDGIHALQVERLVTLNRGNHVVILDVDGEQAEGGDVARV